MCPVGWRLHAATNRALFPLRSVGRRVLRLLLLLLLWRRGVSGGGSRARVEARARVARLGRPGVDRVLEVQLRLVVVAAADWLRHWRLVLLILVRRGCGRGRGRRGGRVGLRLRCGCACGEAVDWVRRVVESVEHLLRRTVQQRAQTVATHKSKHKHKHKNRLQHE